MLKETYSGLEQSTVRMHTQSEYLQCFTVFYIVHVFGAKFTWGRIRHFGFVYEMQSCIFIFGEVCFGITTLKPDFIERVLIIATMVKSINFGEQFMYDFRACKFECLTRWWRATSISGTARRWAFCSHLNLILVKSVFDPQHWNLIV